VTEARDEEPRMDKVEEARWRIANGYYEMDWVVEEALASFLRCAFRNAE